MRLPENAIGITDILGYRDCPQRFAFGMRRWTEGTDPPEAVHPDTFYGKAAHEGMNWIEADMLTDEEAVDRCFAKYPQLEPDDRQRLLDDFEVYRERDDKGVILVANESEFKVPIFQWCFDCRRDSEGMICGYCEKEIETIYFRGKIDRLYALASNPSVFIHRDYKTSKWRKTEEEVNADKQMWSYNAGIHLFWPECESLTQFYDQLRYGATPTRKSAAQRAEIMEWIKTQVRAILRDEALEPTANEWCPYCPIIEQCSEVRRLSEWSIARIEELAGKTGKVKPDGVEANGIEEYVGDLDQISLARKMCEAYEDSVRGELKKLPSSRIEELGYRRSERSSSVWEPEALAAIHSRVGDDAFYAMISLTKSRAEKLLDDDDAKAVIDMGRKVKGSTILTKKR